MTDTTTKPRLLIDTREQLPYDLDGEEVALETGDYAIKGDYEDKGIIVERKTKSDLIQCCTWERSRFTEELKRMEDYKLPIVVCESSFRSFLKPNKSKVHPNALLGSIASFTAKFGVLFCFTDSRGISKRFVKKLLEKYAKYTNEQ